MTTTVVSVHKDYFPSDPNTSNSTWSLNTTITSYLCDIWFVFAHLFVFHPVRSTLVNTTHSFIHAFVIFIGVPGSYLWSLIQQATLVPIFSTAYFFLRLLINSLYLFCRAVLHVLSFWSVVLLGTSPFWFPKVGSCFVCFGRNISSITADPNISYNLQLPNKK